MIFIATIKNKEIHLEPYNLARFRDWAGKNEGKKLRIEVVKSKRSLKQNALMWKWLEIIATDTGNDPEDIHRYCKGQFLPPRIIRIGGKEVRMGGSTTELSKGAMVEYMMKIEAFAGRLGIILPDPEAYNTYINSAPTIED